MHPVQLSNVTVSRLSNYTCIDLRLGPGICNEGTIRLADGVFDQQGRVEICTNGIWGTICDQGWDDADARILCRDLGYTGTGKISYYIINY